MNGILIINKEKGYTSRDVVNIVSKKLGIKKVGHTGTLDPLATGVLVVCVGNATKLVDLLTSAYKEYIATVELGTLTDSLDSDGKIIDELDSIIKKEEIEKVLYSFIGTYDQEVPIYSAVRVNGKKLYEYARNSLEVELPKRNVEIRKIELVSDVEYVNNKTIFKFRCLVSKGTYIRSLIRDIAYRLNTIGIMTDLIRTKQGKFKIEDSIYVNQIESSKLIQIRDALNIRKVNVDDLMKFRVSNGQILNNIYNEEQVLFLDNENKEIALYITDLKDKSKLRPYKVFGGLRDWH